jgi:cytochrome P450
MTAEDPGDAIRERNSYHFDRHAADYRDHFEEITKDLHAKCPVAWTDTHDGHWVVSGYQALFDIARRADVLSNDHDPKGERRGYKGITIPQSSPVQNGFIEMDPPEQRHYRQALNPYLSPAAVAHWKPFVEEVVRASIDEKIETGSIDFVDDLANIVPAVLTLAMMGLPLRDWEIFCGRARPAHRRRVRYDYRADRARARVSGRASGRAEAVEPRTRHPARLGNRGVPAVLHAGAR